MGKKLERMEYSNGRLYGFTFDCPGCEMPHCITTGNPNGPKWEFNGNEEKPTFNPSVRHMINTKTICHYFIRDGRIEFCSDSTHKLAGKTVDLPDINLEFDE